MFSFLLYTFINGDNANLNLQIIFATLTLNWYLQNLIFKINELYIETTQVMFIHYFKFLLIFYLNKLKI